MPPKRCPECGRFLSNELVASAATASVPCPRCGTPLDHATVVGGGAEPSEVPAPGAAADPGSAVEPDAPNEPEAASVRPPDLDPASVRPPEEDVLAGWDVGASAAEVASWHRDRRPFPVDAVVVAGAAVVGAVVGATLGGRHRVRWSAASALGGAVAAGAVRRIWELRV